MPDFPSQRPPQSESLPTFIKKAIPENESLLGANFHQKFAQKLNDAIAASGIDPAEVQKSLDLYDEGGGPLPPLPESYYQKLEEMADELCLHSQYEIPSHRGGFVGSALAKIKWLLLQVKLRTDVQVSQQAKFNIAALLNLEILAAQNEHLCASLDWLTEELTRRDTERAEEIAALREQIKKLRGEA